MTSTSTENAGNDLATNPRLTLQEALLIANRESFVVPPPFMTSVEAQENGLLLEIRFGIPPVPICATTVDAESMVTSPQFGVAARKLWLEMIDVAKGCAEAGAQ